MGLNARGATVGKKANRKKTKGKKKGNGIKTQLDHVQEYSRASAWQGLLHMIRLDAEREGNGEVLMALWRYDMPTFLKTNHNKYLSLGHRITAGNL